MPRFEDSIVINRPAEEVWAYFIDFFNAPRLSGSGIIGLRQSSPGPLRVGATLQGRRVVLGFETRNTFHITEWDPPHAFSVTVEGRPFRSNTTRLTLETVADGTLFHELVDFQLQRGLKLLWPFVGPIITRRIRSSFARSKAMIEAAARH